MAGTWIAAFKAVLPYVEPIVSVVTPAFTRRKADTTEVLQKQIDELQQAAAQNTANIKELAAQLKQVVVTLEQAAENLEAANRRHWTLAIIAIVMGALSLLAALAVALLR